MNPVFKRIFDIIPKQYHENTFIAGGAAVDLEKALDIDIFVLRIITKHENDVLKAVIALTPGITFRPEDIPTGMPGVKRHIKSLLKTDSNVDKHFNVIADIDTRGLLPPIQIIGSPFLTVYDLLNDFDISTHCVAYGTDGNRHIIPRTTALDVPPKIVNSNIPNISISRYRRTCLRYGLRPDPDELVQLCLTPDPSDNEGHT